MANIIIQKDGQTIAVNPRKLNFIVNGGQFELIESPAKTAKIGIGIAAGVSDLYLLSPSGGEVFLYFPTYVSSLALISPTSGSVYKQYHPVTIQWSKQFLTYANLSYSIDNGATWVQLASANTGSSYSWTAPAFGSTKDILIDIQGSGLSVQTAIQDQFTSIIITSPSASISYSSGSIIPLAWTQVNVPTVNVDYSFDQSNWTNILTNATGSSYNWSYPGGNILNNTYIRIGEYPIEYVSNEVSFYERA